MHLTKFSFSLHPLSELLADDDRFVVPKVIPELTTKRVLTCELVKGVALDECTTLSQETRNNVGEVCL